MTAILLPNGKQQYFTTAGLPAVGYKVATFDAGTSNPRITWQDALKVAQNTNPIILDGRGEASIFWEGAYKVQLQDSTGAVIWTQDNLQSQQNGFTTSLVPAVTNTVDIGTAILSWRSGYFGTNLFLGPNAAPAFDTVTGNIGYTARTAAEIAAGVVPTNYVYPPLYVDRYGTNTTPGTTSMAAAWQAAINVAKKCGQVIRYGVTAPYLIDASLDLTAPVGSVNFGFTIRNEGHPSIAASNPAPSIILKHTGIAFDCTGTISQEFEGLSITTDAVTYPQICFLLARNTDARSQLVRFRNCAVLGNFSKTIVYNYGSEDDQYQPCSFYNRATTANTSVMEFTSTNNRAITSAFTTIATGTQSTIDHKIFGGEYANQAGTATSDVFRLDLVSSLKVFGPWMKCAGGAADGRALIYMDTTNGPSNTLTFVGVQGESSAFLAKYGFYFGDAAATPSYVFIESCTLPNRTNAIFANTNVICDDFHLKAVSNQGLGGGINIVGTLQNSHIDELALVTTIGTSTNNILNCNTNLTVTTRSGDFWAYGGTQTWTPNTSALTITGALSISNKRVQYNGSAITVTMDMSAATSIVCAQGTALSGLPVANVVDSAIALVTNRNTGILIGTAQISGTSLLLPAINVGANVVVTITAQYFCA